MAMTRADLAAELKSSLHDAAGIFDAVAEADFLRFIDLAAADFGRVRSLVRQASFDLVADADSEGHFPVPADFCDYHSAVWGAGHGIPPWSPNFPGALPRAQLVRTAQGPALSLTPAATAQQMGTLGNRYRYRYYAAHSVGDTAAETTIHPADRGLLILRAQAEACKELAIHNVVKPLALRDGLSQSPRNGTPAALHTELMRLFLEAAR